MLFIIFVVIVLDQGSKYLVKSYLLMHSRYVLPILTIVWVENHGISFGIFNDPSNTAWPILALTCSITAIILMVALRTTNPRLRWLLMLISAGSISNIIDRLHSGAVFDFIDLHWHEWHYPAFNLADTVIVTGGLLILLLESLRDSKKYSSSNNRDTLP